MKNGRRILCLLLFLALALSGAACGAASVGSPAPASPPAETAPASAVPAEPETPRPTREILAEPTPEPALRHVIPEDARSAPEPDPACYGSIGLDEPEKALEVIRRAREYGLLREDETVIFDPGAEFYYDEDIEYYLDETILVLCWKEVVDGYTCSFAEVKIADPSQLRRKLADDSFDSPNRYFCTELHEQTHAVLSLNADFYQNRDLGLLVWDRELLRYPQQHYTGSYTYTSCLEHCFVDSRGSFRFTEMGLDLSREEMEGFLAENDLLFSLSFGPVLVRDGQVLQHDWYPVGEIDRGYSRAGIGQVDALHYLYMSLNHAPEKDGCWTVNEFAVHFGERAVVNAYCLDGGQTGEMVFQGRPYNHVDFGEERRVSDCLYFASALGAPTLPEELGTPAQLQLCRTDARCSPPLHESFAAAEGPFAVELLLSTDLPVRELQILRLTPTTEEGELRFREEELFRLEELRAEKPLLLTLTFPGDLPSNGLRYVDADGTTRRFAIGLSGEDGSPMLWKID